MTDVRDATTRPDAPVLLQTKLHPPTVPAQTIARERLYEQLAAGRERRLTLVACPPGFEVEVEALNADPSPIEAVTVRQIIGHLEAVVRSVRTPPILIGHSAGGVFTQLLLDRGLGAAGVAINSAPTEGVKVIPLSQGKASFPVLRNSNAKHYTSDTVTEVKEFAGPHLLPAAPGWETWPTRRSTGPCGTPPRRPWREADAHRRPDRPRRGRRARSRGGGAPTGPRAGRAARRRT